MWGCVGAGGGHAVRRAASSSVHRASSEPALAAAPAHCGGCSVALRSRAEHTHTHTHLGGADARADMVGQGGKTGAAAVERGTPRMGCMLLLESGGAGLQVKLRARDAERDGVAPVFADKAQGQRCGQAQMLAHLRRHARPLVSQWTRETGAMRRPWHTHSGALGKGMQMQGVNGACGGRGIGKPAWGCVGGDHPVSRRGARMVQAGCAGGR